MLLSRKIVACAAVVASIVGMGIGATVDAQAETLKFRIQVPKRLLVSTSTSSGGCGMDVWFWGAEGPTVAHSTVSLIAPDGSVNPVMVRKRLPPGQEGGYGIPCPSLLRDTGKWRIRVVAYNRGGTELGRREEAWHEKFDTRIQDAGAAPEPVRRGGVLTVSGRLRRLTDRGLSYTAYSGKTVRIYFRAEGSATWKYMGSARTGADGRFRKGFTARQDGTWRSYFPGTSRFDRQISRHDDVHVR